MKKHYYAEYCPYGWQTVSEYDRLKVFSSRKERDEWVVYYNGVANAMTYKTARARYGLPLMQDKYRYSVD